MWHNESEKKSKKGLAFLERQENESDNLFLSLRCKRKKREKISNEKEKCSKEDAENRKVNKDWSIEKVRNV